MRMRVQGYRQYHQKSLRTKNFEVAKGKFGFGVYKKLLTFKVQ
jgi:hypothetical protein